MIAGWGARCHDSSGKFPTWPRCIGTAQLPRVPWIMKGLEFEGWGLRCSLYNYPQNPVIFRSLLEYFDWCLFKIKLLMSHCKDCGVCCYHYMDQSDQHNLENQDLQHPLFFVSNLFNFTETPPVIEEILRFPSWFLGFRQILRMWLNMGCPRDQRSLRPLPYDYDEHEKRPWSPGGFTWFMAGFNVKTRELLHRLVRYVSKPKSCVHVYWSWRVQCLKCWHVTIAALFIPFYHLRFRFISTYHTSSDFFWRFTSFPVVRAESKIHSQQSIIHGVRTKKTLHWVDLGWQDGGTGFGRRFRHHHRRWGRSQRCRSSNHLGAGLVDMSWCGGT